MSISLHRITVPVYTQMLTNLDFALERGAAFAADSGLDEGEFMQRRLVDDMFTLAQQVQQACFHARVAMTQITGAEAPALPETQAADFAAARARVTETIAFMGSLDADAFDGDPEREITFRNRLGEAQMPLLDYILGVAQAQVYFHCTTAYDLMRAEGVQIGKVDFLGDVVKSRFDIGG